MHKKLIFIGLSFMAFAMNAQSYLGLQFSNYDAISALRYNPGMLTASKMNWQANILSFDIFGGNDFLSLKGSYSDWDEFDRYEDVEENLNGKPKDAQARFDMQGPSFSMRLKDIHAFAVTTRARGLGTVNDMSEPLAKSLWENDLAILDWENVFQDEDVTVGINIFGEMGFSYSMKALEKGQHTLHAGATLKMLFRGVTGYLKAENVSFEHDEVNNTVNTGSTTIDARFSWPFKEDDSEDYEFGVAGLAIDLGAVYEYRKAGEEDYFIRAGLSLVDAGFIRYEASKYSRTFVSSGQDVAEDVVYDAVSDEYIELHAMLDALGTRTVPTGKYGASMPMCLQLFGEIRPVKMFYVSLAGQINLNSQKKNHPSANVANTLTVTPRFEIKKVAVFAPITFNKYSGFDFGVGLRAGQFAIGTSNLVGSFLRKDTKAFNFFMSFGFGRSDSEEETQNEEPTY